MVDSPEPIADNKVPKEEDDDSDGAGSGDDYVAEKEHADKGKRVSV
jgi:hypothetical protein